MITVPADPSLKDLNLLWESQYWGMKSWTIMAQAYERWIKFFGADRKPRDIFRSDVAEYRIWLQKKGWKDNTICTEIERLRRFYRYLNERELVEEGFNPAEGMSPRRIRR